MSLSSTHLSLRHDVEVVAVEGESHISQDGAAVLDDRYSLVLDTTVRRPVNADLRKKGEEGPLLLFIPAREQQRENRGSD